jgi:hypothetical protein
VAAKVLLSEREGKMELKELLRTEGTGPTGMVDRQISLWTSGGRYGLDVGGDGYFACFETAEHMISFLEEARLAIMRDAKGKAVSPGPGVLPVASPTQYAEDNGNHCPCCRGNNLERHHFERRAEKPGFTFKLELHVVCLDCESTWVEVHALGWHVVTYEDLDDRRLEK